MTTGGGRSGPVGSSSRHLAIDFGGESGRAFVGTISDGLELEEIGRFQNVPIQMPDRLAWDTVGMRDFATRSVQGARNVDSVSIDTWGVDFGLLRSDGNLVSPPRSYRDPLTAGALERLFAIVPPEVLYARTGIQMMEINTLCQLMTLAESHQKELEATERLLLMPDLLRFWLSGEFGCERTNASTTQVLQPNGDWATDLLVACGVNPSILQAVVESTAQVGSTAVGAGRIPVVAGASHDTAAAVAGTPLPDDAAYISSGTWSLVGLELSAPVIDERARDLNLSNEHGVGGTTRLLRNVMGLWLIQQCRRAWAREDGGDIDYASLTASADGVPSGRTLIDVDDPLLLRASDIPAAILAQCTRSGEPLPRTRAELMRAVTDSLALRYRWAIEALELCSGRRITTIAITGGGSQNSTLSQATADACARRVEAGPAEATVIGNVLVQGIATGRLEDLAEGRALVRRSFPPRVYKPAATGRWEELFGRYLSVLARLSSRGKNDT